MLGFTAKAPSALGWHVPAAAKGGAMYAKLDRVSN